MIRSMTGFGRASFELEGALFEVEVRTLNHRYLDVSVRLPRFLAAQTRSHYPVHVLDRLGNAFSQEPFSAISQLHRLMLAGGCSGRHGGSPLNTVLELNLDLHRWLPPGVKNFAGMYPLYLHY